MIDLSNVEYEMLIKIFANVNYAQFYKANLFLLLLCPQIMWNE